MFAAHCAAEGRTVLLSTRRITDVRVEPDQVTIAFACWCGHECVVVERRSPVGRPAVAPSGLSTTRSVGSVPAGGAATERPAPARRPVEAATAA